MNPICIVDDEASIGSTVASILRDEGYQSAVFPDAESFWQSLDTMEPALVLLDVWLPGIDGMQLLRRLHDRLPLVPVLMMSGHAGIEAAVAAIKAGAYDFLEKPLHLEVLLDKVASALKHRPAGSGMDLPSDTRLEIVSADFSTLSGAVEVVDSPEPQRTVRGNMVLNGIGLLSGRNTGIILSPLGTGEGIVFQTLDGQTIPGHITSLEDYGQ